jgi:hypothetical protein
LADSCLCGRCRSGTGPGSSGNPDLPNLGDVPATPTTRVASTAASPAAGGRDAMPNLMPIAVLDYRANGTRARSDGTRARFEGCRDNDNPDLPATPPTRVASPIASPFVQDDDALYDEGPSPIVRRYRQQQLQLAPVAPVESPATSIQCDHPMLVCSAGYSLIEDFSYIPECPDCGKLVHCGHRGFCPELCGCDDYLARYPPDY